MAGRWTRKKMAVTGDDPSSGIGIKTPPNGTVMSF